MSQLKGKWIVDASVKIAKIDKDTATAKQLIAVNSGGTAIEWVTPDHTYISDFDTQVRTTRLDQMAAPTATVSMNGQLVTNVGNASSATDAINKAQLDAAIAAAGAAAEWQPSVLDRLATPPGSPSSGDRYLIIATATDEWVGKENQIAEWNGTSWDYTIVTTGTYVGVDDETDGIYYFGGSAWTKHIYEATTASNGLTKVGNDVQINPTLGGDGLAFSTGVMSVNVDGSTIAIAADTLEIPNGGVTEAELNTSVAGSGIVGGGGTPLAVGEGTGISVSANAVAIDQSADLTMTGVVQFSNLRVNEGVTVTATSTELNLLDGLTGIQDDDTMASASSTTLATSESIKAYVDARPARLVEQKTLDATMITNKGFTLGQTPVTPAATVIHVAGAPTQHYGVDFNVTGANVSWTGTPLATLLEAGEQVTVIYSA